MSATHHQNPRMTRMYLKARTWEKTLPRGYTVTGGLRQSSVRVVFSDPVALRAALALDTAFNLWICGNREDFLSTDPLAPSVRNPVPFSHTALLTQIEESQYTAAVSVGAHTHMAFPALTHILLPPSFCFTGHILYSADQGYYNNCTWYLTLYPLRQFTRVWKICNNALYKTEIDSSTEYLPSVFNAAVKRVILPTEQCRIYTVRPYKSRGALLSKRFSVA